jgi:hypothetical protein
VDILLESPGFSGNFPNALFKIQFLASLDYRKENQKCPIWFYKFNEYGRYELE